MNRLQKLFLRRAAFVASFLAGFCLLGTTAGAQTISSESFMGTTAAGWTFGAASGSTAPYLTANTVDTDGTGWLRLTESVNNQATYALWDNSIFSVNAQIQIEMEYTFYNGHDIGGAQNGRAGDGMTFFLVDASKTSGTFQPGAYGGSLGYAQIDSDANGSVDKSGMPGGYLGFGFDNWGNYAGNTEGRVGGIGTTLANGANLGYANRLAVRGPDDGDGNNATGWDFIAASSALNTLSGGGQMDFPTSVTRPDQSGADYRSFRLTLDANNQLTVEMKFGQTANYITVFTADLSTYDRPDYFKLGFTAGTGGANEIHEIRNLEVTMTPWQPDAFEWDNSAGATKTWSTASNWVTNAVPGVNADILFGNMPTTGMNQTVTMNDANKKVNSITFDSGFNYTLNGSGSLLLGDTAVAGLPSINVNDYNGAQAQHHINVPITIAEELKINNYSFSTLCLNGTVETGGNDIKVNGNGAVNFNADISGSGNLIKSGGGITTINNDNSNDPDGALTAWSGNVTINGGMVVVTKNGALGTTGGTTTVNDGGVLAFRAATGNVAYSLAESVTIKGHGVSRGSEGQTGAIYNDGGNNSFAGNITLAAASGVGSRDGVLTLSGVVSDGAGTYNLTKLGEGVVELSNTGNNYNGATIIAGGALRISGGSDALAGGFTTNSYTGGNLQLAGGVLESNVSTTFSRRLGVGADQVQWTGDGGFSAYGANRTVTLTNSGNTTNGTLTWNAGSFVPTGNALLLSSDYANAMVTLTNAINFGGASREVRVANGSAAIDATLSGVLSNGGLIKTGDGTLNISGANTYTGATEIRGGALRGTINASSNVTLNGGVLEITADFTRSLGTGGTNVQWTGDGGFAAYGNNRSVSLNGNSNAVTWGNNGFVLDGKKLILGSTSANRTVTLTNAINLNGGDRTVLVQNGSATTDAVLSGILSNGSLTVVGAGRLDSTGINTLGASDNATLTVKGAEFRLLGTGTATTLDNVVVREGGTFTLDNSSTNNTDRLFSTATVTLNGGTFSFLGASAASSELVGALTLSGGANTINVQRNGNNFSQLTFASLESRTGGATVDFTNALGGGTLGSADSNPRVLIGDLSATTAQTSTTGTIVGGWATVGNNWATYNATTGIAGLTNYQTGDQGTSWTGANVAMSANRTLSADRAVNSLKIDGSSAARTLDLDNNTTSRTFTINSGGILSVGSNTNIIKADNAGSILRAAGTTDLVVHTQGANNTLQINAQIANTSGNALVKSGDGTLVLGGTMANTYTGTTYVNAGTLALNKTAGVNAIAGNIVVGDGRGTDILRLDADEQIANTSNLKLVGSAYGTGETVLQFNGGSSAGISETLGTLTIEGTAVIDFAGGNVCDANFLFLDDLLMASPDSMLYIRNWVDFTDFLLVKNTANLSAVFSQIKFEGYGDTAYWESYDSTYSRITPVPEPSTYGAILMGAGLAFFGYRRWKSRANVQSAS